jgi:hypothetical protein
VADSELLKFVDLPVPRLRTRRVLIKSTEILSTDTTIFIPFNTVGDKEEAAATLVAAELELAPEEPN